MSVHQEVRHPDYGFDISNKNMPAHQEVRPPKGFDLPDGVGITISSDEC